jgi:AcrR family transcriptional regulator
MARWQSGSRERLAAAALRLFEDPGYERTTVAEIAAEAGLTERTFFRYYADKKEVLFAGQVDFDALFVAGLTARMDETGHDAVPPSPLDAVAAGIEAAAVFFPDEKRTWSRRRQRVLDAHPPLLERELHKLSAVADALTGALVERGVDPVAAALAAEAGVSVFRRSFTTWIAEDETRSFAEIQREVLDRLRGLLA